MAASITPPIIDADGHVVEPSDVWAEIPEDAQRWIPTPVVEGDHFFFRSGEHESFRMRARPESLSSPRGQGERSGAGQPAVGAADPKARLSDMDLDGISQAVVFPTYGLMVQAIPERQVQLALCRGTVCNVPGEWIVVKPRCLTFARTLVQVKGCVGHVHERQR